MTTQDSAPTGTRRSFSAEHRAFPAIARPASGRQLIRNGVVTYICALLVIAAFCVASHFVTDSIIRQQQDTARLVNISGRQRMLAQRIARLSLERAAHTGFRSDAATNVTLRMAIAQMSSSHEALLHGSAALRISPPAPATLEVYRDPPYSLDARTQDFLRHARLVADRPAEALTLTDPDMAALEAAVYNPLLNALNAEVDATQATSEEAIRHLRRVQLILTVAMLLILLAEAVFLYRPLFRRLSATHRELVEAGRTDPLTGCLNRRAFTLESHRILAEARDNAQPIAVLMVDIDHFKSINDRFGHPAGDQVIHAIVATLVANTRSTNLICRMGGEEFALLLRDATPEAADGAARNLTKAIAAMPVTLDIDEGPAVAVTVSIGVATLRTTDATIFTVLSRADRALYAAKVNGRNRVEWDAEDAPKSEWVPLIDRVRA